jgi:hypothetical protein
MFLGTVTVVVCLKHVGNTDSVRDRLRTSVKTLASCSEHAQSTHPGYPPGTAALWMLTCLKVLLSDYTVIRNSWCSHACFSVTCLEASIEVI